MSKQEENTEEIDLMSRLLYSSAVAACGGDEKKMEKIISLVENDDDIVNFISAFGILACEEQKKICSEFFPEDKKSIYLQASKNVLEQS